MLTREERLERQRAFYRKHREKRLLAKREEWARDHDKMIARGRAQYAKHAEARKEYAREYRQRNRERLAVEALARYARNRDARLAQRKVYRKEHYAKIYARIQEWRKRNPEREQVYHAKRVLAEQTGVRVRDIPEEVALAKLEQLKVGRLVRELLFHRDGDNDT